jgi:AcrR family transcriptional regulator
MTASRPAGETRQVERRRRPRGAVRDGLVAAGLELARTGGPDAVVLREATRMVGVVPNAAYRHFADRDELLAAVCAAAMDELAARMAAGVARVAGGYGDPDAARGRLGAIGIAYLAFAREEPGLFATAFALPQQHAYGVPGTATGSDRAGPESAAPESAAPESAAPESAAPESAGPDRTPLGQLRAALDEQADAGLLDWSRRDGIEYPVWAIVHGLAVLAGSGPLRDVPEAARHRLDELIFGFIQDGLTGG